MRQVVKEYFDEKKPKTEFSSEVLLRIREEKLRRWKFFSVLLLLTNVFIFFGLILSHSMSDKDYKIMSAGIEVKINPNISFEKLHNFLSENKLWISGPTQEGSYFLYGASREEVNKLIKNKVFIRPKSHD